MKSSWFDSHSSDRTRELAGGHGSPRNRTRDWPGFGPQKAFAVSSAAHDWVLCVDADERISPELRAEILAWKERADSQGARGYLLPRMSKYLGRWIRHGSWYPDRVLRMFDRRCGNYDDALVHEKVRIEGAVQRMSGHLLHLPYRDLSHHLRTIERYTGEMAHKAWDKGDRARWYHLLLNPVWRFFKFYVVQSGWRDGWQGFLLACLAAHYNGLKYIKLYAMGRAEKMQGEDPATYHQDCTPS